MVQGHPLQINAAASEMKYSGSVPVSHLAWLIMNGAKYNESALAQCPLFNPLVCCFVIGSE